MMIKNEPDGNMTMFVRLIAIWAWIESDATGKRTGSVIWDRRRAQHSVRREEIDR